MAPIEGCNMEVLWLAQEEVKSVMDMHSDMQVVERAFRQHGLGKVQMPPKSYLYYTAYNGDLRTMPAYLEEEDITGVKIVNVHPRKPHAQPAHSNGADHSYFPLRPEPL